MFKIKVSSGPFLSPLHLRDHIYCNSNFDTYGNPLGGGPLGVGPFGGGPFGGGPFGVGPLGDGPLGGGPLGGPSLKDGLLEGLLTRELSLETPPDSVDDELGTCRGDPVGESPLGGGTLGGGPRGGGPLGGVPLADGPRGGPLTNVNFDALSKPGD